MTEATKNEKGRCGEYRIFHVGKMAYTVEFRGSVVGQFKALSPAWAFADRKHRYTETEA